MYTEPGRPVYVHVGTKMHNRGGDFMCCICPYQVFPPPYAYIVHVNVWEGVPILSPPYKGCPLPHINCPFLVSQKRFPCSTVIQTLY